MVQGQARLQDQYRVLFRKCGGITPSVVAPRVLLLSLLASSASSSSRLRFCRLMVVVGEEVGQGVVAWVLHRLAAHLWLTARGNLATACSCCRRPLGSSSLSSWRLLGSGLLLLVVAVALSPRRGGLLECGCVGQPRRYLQCVGHRCSWDAARRAATTGAEGRCAAAGRQE